MNWITREKVNVDRVACLRWIAHGFGLLGFSDHEILEREFIVYDALYAECQKRVEA